MMVKVPSCDISIEDYLTCEKILDKFEMKNMGDYCNHYFKKDVLELGEVYWYMFEIFCHVIILVFSD